MNFGVGTRNDLTVTMQKLPKRNACKYFGVYLDEKLLYPDHIEYVVKKMKKFQWIGLSGPWKLPHNVPFVVMQLVWKTGYFPRITDF